jgi:hypothetical protein
LYRRLGEARAGLDRRGKSRLHRDSIPGPSLVLISTTLSRSPRYLAHLSLKRYFNFVRQKSDPEKKNVFFKYKDLTIETQRMWNVKTKVIPVTIGATGTISKSFRKYLSNIPREHDVKELQKEPYWALHTYCRSTNVKVRNTEHGK